MKDTTINGEIRLKFPEHEEIKRNIIKESPCLLDDEDIFKQFLEIYSKKISASNKESSYVPIVGELKFPEITAAPYILEDDEIRRSWDYIHEVANKDQNLEHFIKYSSPIASFNDNIVYSILVNNSIKEYIVFDNPIADKATRYLFYIKFIKSKSRNGLFNVSANGWYPSNVWRSKNSLTLGNKFVLSMLEFAFDDLDADFLVSDFMQTSIFTERFKEFLLLRLRQNRIYVGLSFNKKYPICVPIENEQDLIYANTLISRGGVHREYSYKSIFILRSKYALEKVITKNTKIVSFEDAIHRELFTKSKLDPELEEALSKGTLIE